LNSTQQSCERNWIEANLNWIWIQFNSIQANSIQISKRTLTMLNPKEKNIVFGSIHFNLVKIFEFNWVTFNSSCIMQIHSIWNHSNET